MANKYNFNPYISSLDPKINRKRKFGTGDSSEFFSFHYIVVNFILKYNKAEFMNRGMLLFDKFITEIKSLLFLYEMNAVSYVGRSKKKYKGAFDLKTDLNLNKYISESINDVGYKINQNFFEENESYVFFKHYLKDIIENFSNVFKHKITYNSEDEIVAEVSANSPFIGFILNGVPPGIFPNLDVILDYLDTTKIEGTSKTLINYLYDKTRKQKISDILLNQEHSNISLIKKKGKLEYIINSKRQENKRYLETEANEKYIKSIIKMSEDVKTGKITEKQFKEKNEEKKNEINKNFFIEKLNSKKLKKFNKKYKLSNVSFENFRSQIAFLLGKYIEDNGIQPFNFFKIAINLMKEIEPFFGKLLSNSIEQVVKQYFKGKEIDIYFLTRKKADDVLKGIDKKISIELKKKILYLIRIVDDIKSAARAEDLEKIKQKQIKLKKSLNLKFFSYFKDLFEKLIETKKGVMKYTSKQERKINLNVYQDSFLRKIIKDNE